MTSRQITTSSGTRLGITGYGDPASGRLVVLFHPAPGASRFDPDPAATRHWGVRLLGIERPGYGASDPAGKAPSFVRFADDVAEYLRRIETNAEQIGTVPFHSVGAVGWGVGAIAAAVLAARHPRQVDALLLVDAPADARLDDLHAPFQLADLGIGDEPAAEAAHPDILRRVGRMLDDAGRQGEAGIDFDRAALDADDWKDRLGGIDVPTVLVYGDDHPFVRADRDGAWLSDRIPSARVVRVPDVAGLAVGAVWSRILTHVAPEHGATADE